MIENKSVVCFNGEFCTSKELKISPANRAFRYGDGFFETIRCFGNRAVLFDIHYQRLLRAVSVFEMNIRCIPAREQLLKKIETVINRNKYFVSSRVRVTVFRNDGGLYTPETNDCSYLIEASPLEYDGFVLNEKGLIVSVFNGMKKGTDLVSGFKTASSLLYVMAGLYKKKSGLSEVFIQNVNGKVIETLSSNLFWFKGDYLFTPSVSSGCVDGVMRHVVIELAKSIGVKVIEVPGVDYDELKAADELFITNAVQGINWIVGVDGQRYYNVKTSEIYKQLKLVYR